MFVLIHILCDGILWIRKMFCSSRSMVVMTPIHRKKKTPCTALDVQTQPRIYKVKTEHISLFDIPCPTNGRSAHGGNLIISSQD